MTFNALKIGQKASVQKTFTAADVTAFAGISLDVNPIHMSDKYAEGTIFGKRIVHGILTSGLISAVLATIVCPNHSPQMSTVRPGIMQKPAADEHREGTVITRQINWDRSKFAVTVMEEVQEVQSVEKIADAAAVMKQLNKHFEA